MPFGSCEVPKPGCDGAITRPPRASAASTGASGSMPMPGCKKRIGRPCPRSVSSIVVPLTAIDETAPAPADILSTLLKFFRPFIPLHERGRCFKIALQYAFAEKEQHNGFRRKAP